MSLALASRFKASVAVVTMAAAGLFAVSAINPPEALAACTGSIQFSNTFTKVTNTSQCYRVRASIEGYVSGGVITPFYGAIAVNQSEVNLPSGAIYVRNGMGLQGSSSAGWSWSYYVY